jgi:hypothetical protein
MASRRPQRMRRIRMRGGPDDLPARNFGVCPGGQRQGSEPDPLPPRTQGRVGETVTLAAVRNDVTKPSLFGSGSSSAGQPVRYFPWP